MSTLHGIIAHRGASEQAPENTFAAFEKAVELGADAIEIDVQLSADGQLVVMHDETLDRTTDGTGLVSHHTVEQLIELDAGSWFGPQFSDQRVPTLIQVLSWAEGRCRVDIEVKNKTAREIPVQTLATLVAEAGAENRVAITSFERDFIESLQRLFPHLEVGLLISPIPPLKKTAISVALLTLTFAALASLQLIDLLSAGCLSILSSLVFGLLIVLQEARSVGSSIENLNADAVLPHWLICTRSLVASAHNRSLNVVGWTANNSLLVKHLRRLGIDGLITDKPGHHYCLRRKNLA